MSCAADSDCGSGAGCAAGSCVAKPDSTALDFLGVDAGTPDFKAPLPLPLPALTIEGATDSLRGTWVQSDCTDGNGCLQLVIETDASTGETTGYAVRQELQNDPVRATTLAPASDPNVGYPPEFAAQYAYFLQAGFAGYRYRLFDARLVGDQFSAWWSYAELWNDWCALQTPYLVDVMGEARYVCSPDIRDTRVDFGKRQLCTSADMGGCTAYSIGRDELGNLVSCSTGETPECLRDRQCICNNFAPGESRLCGPSYCQCDASRCQAAFSQGAVWINMTLSGQELSGTELDLFDSSPLKLNRVAP
jgi:hypothetical protein